MNKLIYCIGGATIDYKIFPLHALQKATSNPAISRISFGGVARNIADNLSRLTKNVYLQTFVGDDLEGKQLLAHADELNINISLSKTLAGSNTGRYFAILKKNGELHYAFAAMQLYEEITLDSVFINWEPNNIILLDTNFPSSILKQIIDHAKNKNCQLIVDPVSVEKAKKLPEDLSGIFLIKPNQSEAEELSGVKINSISSAMTAGKKIIAQGAKNVVISLGKNGYVFLNDDLQIYQEALPIKNMTDENGAGDAFCAGIIFGIKENLSLISACEFGAEIAAATLQKNAALTSSIANKENRSPLKTQMHHPEQYEKIF